MKATAELLLWTTALVSADGGGLNNRNNKNIIMKSMRVLIDV